MRKFPRYKVVTTLLVIYAVAMAAIFGKDLLVSGHYLRFFLTVGAEAVAIYLAFIYLRKRDRLRDKSRNN